LPFDENKPKPKPKIQIEQQQTSEFRKEALRNTRKRAPDETSELSDSVSPMYGNITETEESNY
jgi:hypothetical protein